MKCEHGLSPWWDCDPCRGSATIGEEPMEPTFDEHVSPTGETFTTRAERRRFMAKNGLEYKDVSRKLRGRIYMDMGRR